MDDDDNDPPLEPVATPRPFNMVDAPPTWDSNHYLSLNALNGSHGIGTMRFQGQIQGIAVTVLLDTRSSYNFLQPMIAQSLQFLIQSATKFQVLVEMIIL